MADVEAFPGHVACSALSRSELVLPVRDGQGNVKAVFDLDSAEVDDFSDEDAAQLQAIIDRVAQSLLTGYDRE